MFNVVCIRAGELFSPAYVTILRDMVARNLEGGFEGRFVCFTDRPDDLPTDIMTAPLPADLPGWWSKLALFRKDLFPEGDRVLFFDLDTVIAGAIDRLAKFEGEFAILRDFYRPNGFQSSVMAWRAGAQSQIWESYEAAGCPTDDPRGDQWWIERSAHVGRVQILQDVFPDTFVSFKKSGGVIPAKASVVVFHGLPRPHQVTDGWVPKVWSIGGLSHAELTAVCNTALEQLLDNVRSACARDLPWFDAQNDEHDRHVAIIGGAPSVRDMLDEIVWRKSVGQDIWVLNNAWGELQKVRDDLRSIRPDVQVMLDARPQNREFLVSAKEHLIASQCDPSVFHALEGYADKVTLWHVNSPGMPELLADEKKRVTYLIGGGGTVGMNAIQLAVSRGYRQIHLYGFDSSFRGSEHHAYPQALNDKDVRSDVLYGDKHYTCAPWMVGQAQEFMELAPSYAADGVTITVHGEGLLPDIARDMARHFTPAETRAQQVLDRIVEGSVGVEIGVFAGEMSRALLKSDKVAHLTMVDSWEGEGAAYVGDSGDFHAGLTRQMQDGFYQQAVSRTRFANGRHEIVRKRSTDALGDVADTSLDFVFIDADHSYEGCRADIEGWRHKVKPGGWLGGHDYANHDFPKFGVTRAVDEFVSRHSLKLETGDNFCWFVQL